MSEKPREENKAEQTQNPSETKTENPKIEVDAEEYNRLVADLKKSKAQVSMYKAREKNMLIRGEKKTEEAKAPETQEPKHEEHKEGKSPTEQPQPHFLGPWHKYCPECGTENPTFKDEVKCKDCGFHFGALENLNTEANPKGKIKACPNCGGKHAKMIQ